jgi:hypothetical protein
MIFPGHKKSVIICTVALIFSLAWIATHLLPNSGISYKKEKPFATQHVDDLADPLRKSMRYTAYEGKYRRSHVAEASDITFFNQHIQGVVVNQWRANTPANVRACAGEWRDNKTFSPLCSTLSNSMIIEVEMSSGYAIKKILVPLPLNKSVSIGDQVSVVTGDFDAVHESGSLPLIEKIIDSSSYELVAG